jgi:hypothetical protein
LLKPGGNQDEAVADHDPPRETPADWGGTVVPRCVVIVEAPDAVSAVQLASLQGS